MVLLSMCCLYCLLNNEYEDKICSYCQCVVYIVYSVMNIKTRYALIVNVLSIKTTLQDLKRILCCSYLCTKPEVPLWTKLFSQVLISLSFSQVAWNNILLIWRYMTAGNIHIYTVQSCFILIEKNKIKKSI